MCPVCKGIGVVAANDVTKGGECPQCLGYGAIVRGLEQPHCSGCGVPGCGICSHYDYWTTIKEKPKKMNWPIAIYAQDGTLPIKFGIEQTICNTNFSLRLINEFADGWKIIMWYNNSELRMFRTQTLPEAEAIAQELLLELSNGFSAVCAELGLDLSK